jgi:hypothetical protein
LHDASDYPAPDTWCESPEQDLASAVSVLVEPYGERVRFTSVAKAQQLRLVSVERDVEPPSAQGRLSVARGRGEAVPVSAHHAVARSALDWGS